MITVQVSDKGRITIPAAMRRELGLEAKSRVVIEMHGDNEFTIRPLQSVEELGGISQNYATGAERTEEPIG